MKLTRDQQVKRVLKILAPAQDERAQCAELIDQRLKLIELQTNSEEWNKLWAAKDTKRKLRSFQRALRRLQAAHKALPAPKKFFGLQELDLKKHIDGGAEWLSWPSRKPKRSGYKQRLAVREARYLLQRYGRPVSATRKGLWCELAAILYGERNANLYHYCSDEKGPNRG